MDYPDFMDLTGMKMQKIRGIRAIRGFGLIGLSVFLGKLTALGWTRALSRIAMK